MFQIIQGQEWVIAGIAQVGSDQFPHLKILHKVPVLCEISFLFRRSEVRFVTAVTAAGSVNFFASGVNFSKNTHFLCFYH